MNKIRIFVIAASLLSGIGILGCTTSHTEKDKDNLLGGHTHEETTTTKNPVTGDVSTSHTEQKTN